MWQSAVVFSVVTNAACRVVQCLPPEPSASVVASQSVADIPLVIRGRVLSLETGESLLLARARMSNANPEWLAVDAGGALVVRVAGPGSYTVDVAAPGYDFISHTVVVRRDSGVVWVAVMARTRPVRRNPACGADTSDILLPGEVR